MKRKGLLLLIITLTLFLNACIYRPIESRYLDEVYEFYSKDYLLGLSNNAEPVTNDLILPAEHRKDSVVTFKWKSSNVDIIDNSGHLNRPQEDTVVTLVVTMKYDNFERIKTYDILVAGLNNSGEIKE